MLSQISSQLNYGQLSVVFNRPCEKIFLYCLVRLRWNHDKFKSLVDLEVEEIRAKSL